MIYLEATYKEHRGWFALLMLVSGDMPVTMGREMLGEPKKTGNIRMYHHGDGTYAYGERNGTRLIQIDADLGPDLGPNQTTVFGLELKGQPAPDFVSLHADPWVVVTTQVAENVISREGSGRLYLTGSPFDPVDEVPVVEVGAARYVAGKVDFGAVTWEQLPSREEYVPHIMSRRFYDYATVESPVYR